MSLLSISVIIPVYNAALYLTEAIESVLQQDYPITQFLIIDDGSTDGSDRIAQKFGDRIQYVYQPHQGQGAALNLGIALAEGDYLAFLDADDFWTPKKLSLQASFITANPDVDMVFGYVQQFISPELSDLERARVKVPVDPMLGYACGVMLARHTVFETVGLFTNIEVVTFLDWYARSQDLQVQAHMLPETIYWRRVHLNNISRKMSSQKMFPALLKDILDRRRKLDDSHSY